MRLSFSFHAITVAWASPLLLFGVVEQTEAVKCGQWYSNPCLAETDPRFAEGGNDIKDQDPIWGEVEGYWVSESYFLNGGLESVGPNHFDPNDPSSFPYPQSPFRIFERNVIEGSRMAESFIMVFNPADQEFCDQPVPEGTSNVIVGECGVTGFALALANFRVSSPEKDGRLVSVPTDPNVAGGEIFVAGGRAIVTSESNVQDGVSVFTTDTQSFLGGDYTATTTNIDVYSIVEGGKFVLDRNLRTFKNKVSKEEWLEAYEAALVEANVPDFLLVDTETECWIQDDCPTEELWCEYDPECSAQRVYTEPEGSLDAGLVAGIVALVFLVILLVVIMWYQRKITLVRTKNRELFARRIAETIKLTGPDRELTPEAVQEQFNKMDGKHEDGFIDREELWEFLSSGGEQAPMSKSDFNVLYNAIDLDGDGRVDFLEFYSYMSQCHDDFQRVKNRPSVVAKRPSAAVLRSSVGKTIAEKTAERLSINASALEGIGEIGEDEEEVTEGTKEQAKE